MRRFFGFLLAVGIVCLSSASDESLMRGAIGTYRRFDGMHDEVLTLKADRSYAFTTHFDIGTDEESGDWSVRDGAVVLKVKKRGEVFQKKPTRLLIVVVDGDLALRVQDEGGESEEEDEPRLLFTRDKKRSSQTLAAKNAEIPKSRRLPANHTNGREWRDLSASIRVIRGQEFTRRVLSREQNCAR